MKRAVDVIGALVGLVVTAPIMAVIAVVILVTQGRPIVFGHVRPGLQGRPFRLYKFRTMRNADPHRHRPDGERITRLGRILRSTSLDELPELVNVLRGDMSLVGPRPLLMSYLDLYSAEQARRHEVKPGITGLAQVAGRNRLTWEERFGYDVWYVDHASFWLDVRILVRTVVKVLRREDISHPAHATMHEFEGSQPQT